MNLAQFGDHIGDIGDGQYGGMGSSRRHECAGLFAALDKSRAGQRRKRLADSGARAAILCLQLEFGRQPMSWQPFTKVNTCFDIGPNAAIKARCARQTQSPSSFSMVQR